MSGKTKGLPTYEQARSAGCFHPNSVHTLEYVDEFMDADEIELQRSVRADPDKAGDADAQDERKYEIDQARKMRENPGMTKDEARVAVDRDNLAASIRHGLVRADAEELVAKMTDAQVTALCPNGNPPRFETAKRIKGGTRKEPKHEPERWNHGKRGGVVHIKRDADLKQLLAVTGADKAKDEKTGKADKRQGETPTYATQAEVVDLAKRIESAGRSILETLTLAPIDKATAQEIKAVCGVAPKTLTPTVSGNEIRHTFNRHGNGRERNKKQLPITAGDIARIPDILASRDSIEPGSFNKTENAPSVKLTKNFSDGTAYTVFVIAESLKYKTMWKRKK
ncbi:MAG: hypothetical protein ACI4RD_03990 [Kiritimatiellia bacterium]